VFARYRSFRAIACVAALVSLACASSAVQITKQLADGVSLYQEINSTPGSELVVNSVTVDPKVEGVAIKAALSRDVVYTGDVFKGTETIGSLVGRRGACVGINCDFFPIGTDAAGDPLGVCVIDGELVSEPSAHHAVMAMLKDGTFAFDNPTWSASLTLPNGISRQIDGVNRFRDTNQVIAYTSIFDSATRSKFKGTEVVCTSDDLPVECGKVINLIVTEVRVDAVNTPIPKGGMVLSAGGPAASFLSANLKPGDKLTVRFDIKSAANVDWTQVQQAVGGRPWVLKGGKEYVDLEYEKIGSSSFSTTAHPRTALGITADGKLMLVTVDGRQPGLSRGISLTNLSALMKRLGAVDAINLDGGGSTTMSFRGGIINSPSGGIQRSVANGLLVFANPVAADEVPKLTISAPADGLPAGQPTSLSLVCGDDSRPLAQDQMVKVVWSSSNGMGFINQQGCIAPVRVRHGSIMASYGGQQVTCDVKVIAGPPSELDVKITPDKQDPSLSTAVIELVDKCSNPCVGKPVTLVVTGGKADTESGVFNDAGKFTANITWDRGATTRSVKATSGDLTATCAAPAASTAPAAATTGTATAPDTTPPADTSK